MPGAARRGLVGLHTLMRKCRAVRWPRTREPTRQAVPKRGGVAMSGATCPGDEAGEGREVLAPRSAELGDEAAREAGRQGLHVPARRLSPAHTDAGAS